MKTTVIHHSADFDGLFCREIARKFLPDAELIGWDFGDDPIHWGRVVDSDSIYVMDLPMDRPFGCDMLSTLSRDWSKWVWIDHHKSSIETHPAGIPGYRIDGVAACRLAWQWFHKECHDYPLNAGKDGQNQLPTKQDFIDRTVSEPLAVRLAGEYDIWDKRDPRAELFQHGLRSRELSEFDWGQMLSIEKPSIEELEKMIYAGGSGLIGPDGSFVPAIVHGLLDNGKVLQFARAQEYRDVITQQGFDLQFEGLTFLACNSHELDIRSHLFEAGIKQHHDALLGFTFHGKGYRVSLYRIEGKEADILSIAKRHGGGGHVGACGFQSNTMDPFFAVADQQPLACNL